MLRYRLCVTSVLEKTVCVRGGGRGCSFKVLCCAGLMEYAVGTTHILNGVSLVSSVMEDTPLYQPAKSLWDNQLESPSASGTGRAPSQDRRYIHVCTHAAAGSYHILNFN